MQKKLIRNSDVTISTQLYEMLRQDILENKWKENDKFYSVRQISIKYEVNLNSFKSYTDAWRRRIFI